MTISDPGAPTHAPAPLRGRAVHHGEVVAIAAPSGPAAPHDVHLAGEWLRARGLVAQSRWDVESRRGHLAGGDWRRATELNALLGDPAVRAIWCVRGGFGAARILDAIDLATLRADPRPFVGYSDATALLCGLWAAANLCSIHGPLAAGAAQMSARAAAGLLRLLADPSPPGRLDVPGEVRSLRSGTARGRLLGGNLATLAALCGTKYLPSLAGAVLFVEEDPSEPPLVLDRSLTQLRLSGALDAVAALIVGAFPPGAEPLLIEALGITAAPILAGFPAGHGTENVPLPIGAEVEVDGEMIVALEGVVRPRG